MPIRFRTKQRSASDDSKRPSDIYKYEWILADGKRGRVMVRYDPYTDSFIDNPTKETTATISLDAFPKSIIQMNVVEVSDESIEKIADAVVRKLADRKTEQTEREGE